MLTNTNTNTDTETNTNTNTDTNTITNANTNITTTSAAANAACRCDVAFVSYYHRYKKTHIDYYCLILTITTMTSMITTNSSLKCSECEHWYH